MKPIFAQIPEFIQKEDVFAVRKIDLPYFSTEFHFHNECQMVYVVESEGRRIIGDSVEAFTNDELIFLGPNIPHVWHNDTSYFNHKSGVHARSVALFFNPDKLLGLLDNFVPVPNLDAVIKKGQLGMLFSGHTKILLKELLLDMIHQNGLSQLITFIKILELLSHTDEYKLLASNGYINTYHAKDNDRMDKVFKHVFNEFTTEIQLDEVAALANMNKHAFCRYFKSRTQKTFTEFVNDIRISHACKLMAEGEQYIAGLAYSCGFNSLSNFNRFFKKVKGVTPSEYKDQIQALTRKTA